ncbi:hypothetical protein EV421DRAFT_1907388 [Armillaria borealis]|uniref:Uncharacterized protein n=1 Tax=Armillaria borealis TaxID=47425 RepID=A0AA39J7A0_9AGAR|nr:hypothetical protein EV421DRAFT_1907388 [Armillaria borealis]
MSETSEPPDTLGDMSFAGTTSKTMEAKQMHMKKLEAAAESIVKDYGKAVEIEGTAVSAVFDVMVVLRHMCKNEMKPTKTLTLKQHCTVVNAVNILEVWMDLEEYKAAQDAMALASLMNDNFKSLQITLNTLKSMAETQNTNDEAVNEQLRELKQNISSLHTIVEDLRNAKPHTAPSSASTQSQSQPQSTPLSYANVVTKSNPFADPRHSDVIAKAKLANRCIIRSKKELVKEVNDALSIATTTANDTLHVEPEDVSIVGTRKLANGGIIYTLNSDEAATWLQEPMALENMAQAVGEGNNVSLQLNNVIVPFVPMTINIKNEDTWRNIETSSKLATGTIHSI